MHESAQSHQHRRSRSHARYRPGTAAKDDALSIKGMKSETPRGLRLRAREITKGKDALTLLDKEGRPAWMPRPS